MVNSFENKAYSPDLPHDSEYVDNTRNKKREEHEFKENSNNSVSVLNLFRYATRFDIFLILIGSLASLASGATLPIAFFFYTKIIDSFTIDGSSNCNKTVNNISSSHSNSSSNSTLFDLNEEMRKQAINLTIFAIVATCFSYLRISCWLMSSERQTRMIRKKLFAAILKQEIKWFDNHSSGELTTKLTNDIDRIKEAIGLKFSNAIQLFSTFISGTLISLISGWKLTLVILSMSPLLFVCSYVFTKITETITKNELNSYAGAGKVAEEVLTAIRTVFAFNGAHKEHERYEAKLEESRKYGIKKGIITGFLLATFSIVINSAYALGFWYGWVLTNDKDQEYTVGKILFVFYSIIQAVSSLGNAVPFISILANAKAAAYGVFKIIDNPLTKDSQAEEAHISLFSNDIKFDKVDFCYPSRPEVKVLSQISFKIKTGSTVAFVGSSGSGKSTCIQILQRFYETTNGSVIVGSKDIKSFNVKQFRSQIGVVNQEPILFSTSILENIKYGKEDATEKEVIDAAKQANAHDFIMKLPNKYDTLVGNRGSQLSGGQKQRIAIARALVRNPKLLLLDEATSALDSVSESIVQLALDKARIGRTTIIVAHRLSTIKNADLIYCFEAGKIVEFGTHSDLINLRGRYYSLVLAQEIEVDKSLKSSQTRTRTQSVEKDVDCKKDRVESIGLTNKTKSKEPSLARILALNKPEWLFILIGCIATIVTGSSSPVFSIIFSKVIAVFQDCDLDNQHEKISSYCLLFVGIGIITFISNLTTNIMFGFSGENMTKRLRSDCFKSMLKQDVSWYDRNENSVGNLTTRLATETSAVQKATGLALGNILMNLSNLGVGILIAFISSWTITLVILVFVPIMVLLSALQTKLISGYITNEKEILEDSGKISNESISNIKTVAILNKQEYFSKSYSLKIDSSLKDSLKLANINGFMIGLISSIMVFAIAAAFVLGGYLVKEKLFDLTFEKIIRVFSCLFYGAQSMTEAAALLPDYAKAKVAISKIFELFDRVTVINNWTKNKSELDDSKISSDLNMDSINFEYPNRPEVKVFENLTFEIKQGQKIAFVGGSGCGKSTVIQLIERFYDPCSGEVKMGRNNLKALDLGFVRSKLSIVSQEPVLFDITIAENIAYGDNSRNVKLQEIIDAAKQANIHDFIISLPQGYQTKGTNNFSGGQKQRICIARALIKNPDILLLDEATSALDSESEKLVQNALEKAQNGRTCIIIAHRLSTVRNCDVIYVMKNGSINEKGTHDELIKINGFYSKLSQLN